MRFKITLVAIFALLIGAFSSIALAQDDAKQSQISNLVRSLGYGAAIHNFKNYVLRGKHKYRQNASRHFDAAKAAISALQQTSLSNEESLALSNIEKVVDEYQAALLVAQEQIESAKKFSEIIITTDAMGNVDDAPALEGITTLRKAYQWTDLEALEYALGYGAAIQNFKNYLLRGADKYRSTAKERFEEAGNIVSKISANTDLSDEEKTALADISTMIKGYQKGFPKVKATASYIQKTQHDRLKSLMITSSDKAVKVNDGPAVAGLVVLGKRYLEK